MIPVQEMKSVIVLGYGYEDLKESNNKKVVFNGQIVRDSYYSDFGLMKHFCIYENKYSEWIRDERICDLFQGEDCEIKIEVDQEFLNDDMLLESSDTMLSFRNKKCCVQFEGQFNSEEWDKGCSIRDMTYGLRDKIQERGNVSFACRDSDTVLNGFILRKEVEDCCAVFRDLESELIFELRECYYEAKNEILQENRHSVTFAFQTDDRVKVACRQYLDYFVQFLEDLGMESQANTYERLNEILFEVIPKDKNTALSKIKECLVVYLSLIDNREIETVDIYDNVAYMQLKANISHLKSQLMLAQATIEQKDVTIRLLKELNDKSEAEDKDKDGDLKLLDGVITVGEIDCRVLKLNLGRLLELLFRRK